MKKNHKSILILVTLLFYFLLCVLKSNQIISIFLEYSHLFFTKLFPVSFLMLLFSSLLIRYQFIEIIFSYGWIRTYRMYIFLLSLVSGYPSGAKYTKELWERGKISIEEANHMIMFSHFPNPLFVLGSLLPILPNKKMAFFILFSIWSSNFLLMIFHKKETNRMNSSTIKFPKNFTREFTESLFSVFHTLALIYGISIFFYGMASMIMPFLPLSPRIFIFWNGFFDLTKGVFSTSVLENVWERSYWILGFLSMGSLSIHIQVKSILEDTPISYSSFWKGRILGTIISFAIFILLQ